MTLTSKTIIFFGTDEFSAVSLRELIAKGFSIGAVVTKPDSRKGRGRQLSKSIVKEIAETHAIPVWQPTRVAEIAEHIAALNLTEQPIGVLVSYGKLIPESIISLFSPGIINVHPSLLPRYRGPSPVESAILHGDTETGVTIMQLSKEMDAGPIYSQVPVPLNDTETTPVLEQQLATLGAQQLSLTLPAIITGATLPTPQDEQSATYCQLLKKEDAFLDVTHLTAEQAERRIRAYLAFPKSKLEVAGQQIVITKAHCAGRGDATATIGTPNSSSATTPSSITAAVSPLNIPCADGRILTIDELIGPSGKPMSAKAFLNGYIK